MVDLRGKLGVETTGITEERCIIVDIDRVPAGDDFGSFGGGSAGSFGHQ